MLSNWLNDYLVSQADKLRDQEYASFYWIVGL